MSTVVNVHEIQKRFETLGWTLPTDDLPTLLAQAGITGAELVAYLDALIAAPTGLNDQTIPGCSTSSAGKLTKYFKDNGCEAV